MNTGRDNIYTASICITGRCNCNCSYCHFYSARKRKDVFYDLSSEQFDTYMQFLKLWSDKIEGDLFYRFSGGDPLVLGDRLFRLADRGFEMTGIKPFVLTSGRELDEHWVEKAKNSAIGHVFVSIENPLSPDKGAPNPIEIARKIKYLNSDELPIVPGVSVVPNNYFSHLYEICDWFMKNVGSIPLVCEINYGPYKKPTQEEWGSLKNVLPVVIKRFFEETQLNLFSSVVPEFDYGGKDPYLFELGLDNSHGIRNTNLVEKVEEVFLDINQNNYPKLSCKQKDCPWSDFCQNTKWYWQHDKNLSREEKLNDYCQFKRIISDAYYRVLVDLDHEDKNFSMIL